MGEYPPLVFNDEGTPCQAVVGLSRRGDFAVRVGQRDLVSDGAATDDDDADLPYRTDRGWTGLKET